MEEKYKKMMDDRIQYFIDKGEKFVELTSNGLDGRKRVFLMPMKMYKKLTNKQKKLLMEDK